MTARTRTRQRAKHDGGFALIEVIVALMLLSIVATSALAFFIRTTRNASELQRRQAASTVAVQTMEYVRSVAPTNNTVTGLSKLVQGRTQTAVTAQWAATPFADRNDTYPAWDTSPTPGTRLLADTYTSTVSKQNFTADVIVGVCYRIGANGPCTKAAGYPTTPPATLPLDAVKLYRAVVVVTWNTGAGSNQCSGSSCRYVLSSLIDPSVNPIFNPNYVPPAPPVGYSKSLTVDVGATGAIYPMADAEGMFGASPFFRPDGTPGWTNGSRGVVSTDVDPAKLDYTAGTASWSGIDTFTYTLTDVRRRTSAPATVTVTVKPTATADTVAAPVVRNVATTITVLGNDKGTWLTTNPVRILSAPLHGSAVRNASGDITYTSAGTYVGSDTFTYEATDQTGNTASATVTVQVVHAAPTGSADAYSINYNTATLLSTPAAPLANDSSGSGAWAGSNPVTIVSVSTDPTRAQAAVNASTGAITYSPPAGFSGTATIIYYATNSVGARTGNTTISVSVGAAPAPTAANDSLTAGYNRAYTLDVLMNDASNSLPAGWPASPVTLMTADPSFSVDTSGLVTYTPTVPTFVGTKTFQYTVTNRYNVTSAAATVTLTVSAAAAVPTAVADSPPATNYNTAIAINVLSNDAHNSTGWSGSNPVAISTAPSAGTAVANASSGVVTYTPPTGISGTFTFEYTAKNASNAVSAPVTVTVTVGTAPAGTLISQGRIATSSSNENGGLPPSLAVDGNSGTRWSSGFSDPQSIVIDLGSVQTLSKVVLLWEAAYGKSYIIESSVDGATWTNRFTTSAGDGGLDTIPVTGTGRYVRMTGTARATVYGYSLFEMQVFS